MSTVSSGIPAAVTQRFDVASACSYGGGSTPGGGPTGSSAVAGCAGLTGFCAVAGCAGLTDMT
jgi:hypothetical protein